MAVFKRGKWYRYEFMLNGKRIQESARTTSKTLAIDAERHRRRELEQAALGVPIEQRSDRIRSIGDRVREYLETYSVNHRPASVAFAEGRLAHVTRVLGTKLLSELTEREVRLYMRTRLGEGVNGRTINAELGDSAEPSASRGKPFGLACGRWRNARTLARLFPPMKRPP